MKVESVLPRDSIPSIDAPAFASGYFGDQEDEVIVVDGDPPRAYPIRILSYHEIVNDSIDGRPIAVTWCPICWSAAVYDRTVDGRTLTFGMSGKLADHALVMYDRETESEWKQPTGTAIAGSLEGMRLSTLPAPIIAWNRFTADYPGGVVLQPVHGTSGESGYSQRAIYDMQTYEQYVDREAFGLYGMRGEGEQRAWDREDLEPKTVVLGIEHGGDAIGYPLDLVKAQGGRDRYNWGCSRRRLRFGRWGARVRASRLRVRTSRRNPRWGRDDVEPRHWRKRRWPTTRTAPGPPTVRVRLARRTRT